LDDRHVIFGQESNKPLRMPARDAMRDQPAHFGGIVRLSHVGREAVPQVLVEDRSSSPIDLLARARICHGSERYRTCLP